MLLLPFALASCASSAVPVVAPLPATEITYETGPCFGACPVYMLTVRNLGRPSAFEGKRFAAVEGTRAFTVDEATFNAFYQRLRPTREAVQADYEGGGRNCQRMATDHPSVTVTFREGEAPPRSFRFYYGCRDPQNAALAESLRSAPDLLPIATFIGKR